MLLKFNEISKQFFYYYFYLPAKKSFSLPSTIAYSVTTAKVSVCMRSLIASSICKTMLTPHSVTFSKKNLRVKGFNYIFACICSACLV